MANLFFSKYNRRPGGIPQYDIDQEGLLVVYPGELFCRVLIEDGILCPAKIKFKDTHNLRAHLRNQHPNVVVKSWGRRKLTDETLLAINAEFEYCELAAQNWLNSLPAPTRIPVEVQTSPVITNTNCIETSSKPQPPTEERSD